jgi:hypothetical protein
MDLEDRVTRLEEDVSDLKINQAETKVYVKQIFERLEDLKTLFTTGTKNNNSTWLEVSKELIKLVAIVGGIIAGVKLL